MSLSYEAELAPLTAPAAATTISAFYQSEKLRGSNLHFEAFERTFSTLEIPFKCNRVCSLSGEEGMKSRRLIKSGQIVLEILALGARRFMTSTILPEKNWSQSTHSDS